MRAGAQSEQPPATTAVALQQRAGPPATRGPIGTPGYPSGVSASSPPRDDALGRLLRRAVVARARPAMPVTDAPRPTSPPSDVDVDVAIGDEQPVELTSPGAVGGHGPRAPGNADRAQRRLSRVPVPLQNPQSLVIKGSGPIVGTYGISDYWPGVTSYWGADKTLGKFDRASAGGWRMIGHKFQVIGTFSSGTTTTAAGGPVTFLQEARITNTKGGTPGAWFNDMDYVDAWGGAHQWDPNAEAGTTGATGYAGVRRTVATTKYAYTDPPAISYQPGTTDTYRKLEFRITLIAPPGASRPNITKKATQEIEVVKGTPKILQAP